MLQYRKTHNTNDDFEAEGDHQQLILFVIYNDITYEHHVEHIFDIQRIIEHINDFTVHFMDEFIDVKYYSMTFRLNPVGENVQVILKLRNEIAQLKKQIAEHPIIQQPIIQQRPPSYLPPNLSLLCEVEYLPWDTLEDLFYMYPLREILDCSWNDGFNNIGFSYNAQFYTNDIFKDPLTTPTFNIDSFNPEDAELDKYINIIHAEVDFGVLARSCNPPYTQNKKINIYVLYWITLIFSYYALYVTTPLYKRQSPSSTSFISANIFINHNTCKMQILNQRSPNHQLEIKINQQQQGMKAITFKYRINFYIDDWSAPPVVVYV
jgi:hypothetical protein